MEWFNYFVTNKFSRLINGHLKAEDLLTKILEHDGEEAYACYFDLDKTSLKVEWDNEEYDKEGKKIYEYLPQGTTPENPAAVNNGLSFTEYEGICRPSLNCVAFDFDSKDPAESLEDVRNFIKWLDIDDAVVFFSGSKGFHVLVHFDYFGLEVSKDLVIQLRDMAKEMAKHFPTLDTSIYNYNRKFRVPFTKHDKTGLYKAHVCIEEGTMEDFLKLNKRNVNQFLPPEKPRKPLTPILEIIEMTKRASYEIEKHRAGTREAPSPFEGYDGKICIKKMLENTCDIVGRNNACMRIVNDFYRTGLPYNIAEEKIRKWAANANLPDKEYRQILSGIYDRGENYNFGCQDEIKASFCSAKCSIYKKLDPEKRPVPLDAPKSAYMEEQKSKKISQKEVVTLLLEGEFRCKYSQERREYWGGYIVRQEDDLFLYEEGYWTELGPVHVAKIKRIINIYLEGKASISQIDNIYKMFLVYVPCVPDNVDMFLPRNNIVNFNNGVLEVNRGKDGKYIKTFREGHSPTDYLTSKHSLDYREIVNPKETCPKFMKVLDDLFKGAPDIEDRIKSIAMMYGASLMPMFPMMYYFYGEAKTGKSTLILILKQLLDEKNLSSVQPKDFHGFELEDMVGKLVNYFTDVNTRKPIDDDIVKVILDRTPVNIRRKNRTSVRACLPSIHLFAGNDLLKSFEASTAMERRWTIIEFLNVINDSESFFANASDFAEYVYKNESDGILNFALWGLNLLVESNGRFIQFESSKKSMAEWQERGDIVSQFIKEVTTEGVDFIGEKVVWNMESEGKINKGRTWIIFDAWQENAIKVQNFRLNKKAFFVSLAGKGHRYIASNGHWISGFSVCNAENGSESQRLDHV